MAATIDDLIPFIYHEQQQEGSMLCAQHALNSLLQGQYFSAPDLSDIAKRLDSLEEAHDENRRGQQSTNMDDTGFFSVQVLEEALQVWGLTLIRWRSEEMRPFQDRPHTQLAFILNQSEHWYSLRRFGPAYTTAAHDPGEGHWFNLNSSLQRPEWISKTYLGMFLQQAETEGYSIFAVVQKDPSGPLALPRTEADEFATAIPEGSTARRPRQEPAAFTTPTGFEDEDMELQAALQASLMGDTSHVAPSTYDRSYSYPAPVMASSQPILRSDTPEQPPRRGYGVLAQQEDEELDEDPDEREVPIVDVPSSLSQELDPIAASRARSQAYMQHVLRQQEAALRNNQQEEAARLQAGLPPLRGSRAAQEEEELMRAIEESRRLHEAAGSPETQEEQRATPPASTGFARDRTYDDEDAELQAALKASLESVPEGFQIPDTPPARTAPIPPGRAPSVPTTRPQEDMGDDDDAVTETESEAESSSAIEPEPQLSMEEIRRRRLAKFGGQ